MRLVERLYRFLERKNISPFTFERNCELGNGYLGKQLKNKGSVGSDILQKISARYPDLNLIWLITGRGKMILPPDYKSTEVSEEADLVLKEGEAVYKARTRLIGLLKEQLAQLESAIPGKRRNRKRKIK